MSPQPLLTVLDQFRGHLTEHDLPEVVSLTLTLYGQGASAQVTHDTDQEAAGNLLGWAHSLSLVRVKAWRPPSSPYALHVTVRGRTSGGLKVEVYASVDYDPVGPGGVLEPGGRADQTLDELRAHAGGASCD
jgi:hypothetical protein